MATYISETLAFTILKKVSASCALPAPGFSGAYLLSLPFSLSLSQNGPPAATLAHNPLSGNLSKCNGSLKHRAGGVLHVSVLECSVGWGRVGSFL